DATTAGTGPAVVEVPESAADEALVTGSQSRLRAQSAADPESAAAVSVRQGVCDRHGFEVEGVGDVVVGDMPVVDVESAGQGRIVRQGLVPSLIGDLDGEGQSRLRQRRGRGAGYVPGHVRHAVVDRVVDGERRIVVRGGTAVLEAAALVDGDVDEDRTRLHVRDHLIGDELRRLLAGDEHGADDEVGTGQGLRDLVLVRHLRRDRTGEGLVDLPQARDVDVDALDVRSEAQSHAGGVRAGHTGADDDDIRAFDPGHAGQQDAAAAAGL